MACASPHVRSFGEKPSQKGRRMNAVIPGSGRVWSRGLTRVAWTDEAIDLLRTLAADGLSASQIAWKMFGQFPGITRNAVIGKAHRKGISLNGKQWWESHQAPRLPRPPRDAPRKSPRKSHPNSDGAPSEALRPIDPSLRAGKGRAARIINVRPKQSATAPIERDLSAPHSLWIPLVNLRFGVCRFPKGDPKAADFAYCGAPSGEKSFCPYHCSIVYEPRRGSRENVNRHA